MAERLLTVRDLKVHFPIKKGLMSRTVGRVKAVDGVSFHLDHGETLGIVGESGCGKTTTGQAVLMLTPPTSGEVEYKGRSVVDLSGRGMRALRREMQIIFQDPYSSLNPQADRQQHPVRSAGGARRARPRKGPGGSLFCWKKSA